MNEPLKNMYNRPYVDDLAAAIKKHYPSFDTQALAAQVFDEQWPGRSLKERMRHITLALGHLLPATYRQALNILKLASADLTGYAFENMIFPDFVELFGLEDWDASIPALEQFTQLISAEFAVRPFIVKDQERMMAQMLRWADHENQWVRRLASEGSRPRLPWGIALHAFQAEPSPILPILEKLKSDPSETVRRSVANNLNDISKDNAEIVIQVLKDWQVEETKEIAWITNQALRTLVKKGNPQALELLGFARNPAVLLKGLTLEPDSIPLGGELAISFEIESTGDETQNLMVDYIVHLMRANGKQTPKVFKLTKRTIKPGETIHLTKRHSFRPVTTRKYYPGEHHVEIQVNGNVLAKREFQVID